MKLLKRISNNRRLKQIFSLYSTMLFGMLTGVGSSIVNTRFLGPQMYGDFKFITHMFNFVVMFLTVGMFFSGSRLLALDKEGRDSRGLAGAMMSFGVLISLLMSTGFFIFSFFENEIYNNNLGIYFRVLSPFLFVYPMKLCIDAIMVGTNDIYKLSFFRFFPKIFYLVSALIVNLIWGFDLKFAIVLNLAGFIIIIVVLSVILKPEFELRKLFLKKIKKENKTYGFPVYISHIANTATAKIGALSVAYFIDNINMGYFSLAVTVTAPLALIPRVVGTTFFKDFASSKKIPFKATLGTVLLGGAALSFFLILISHVFVFIYSKDFSGALPIVYFFAFSSMFQGFGDFVNRFLGAHGRGEDMRRSAFIVAGINLVGYTVLIRYLALDGAVYTRVLAGFAYLCTMIFYYLRFVKSGAHKGGTDEC